MGIQRSCLLPELNGKRVQGDVRERGTLPISDRIVGIPRECLGVSPGTA